MPLPKPTEEETQREFVSRCMADPAMGREYGDRSTRAAQCFTSWRSNKGKSLDVADIAAVVKAWFAADAKARTPEGQWKFCVCDKCGHSQEHTAGVPCGKCPECGKQMPGVLTMYDSREKAAKAAIQGKPGWDEPEGGEYIHYRIKDPALFIEGSFRIVDIVKEKPRVKSTMGKLKPDGTTMVKQNLMFPTEDDWTLAKAKAWVAAHPEAAKQCSDIVLGDWSQYLVPMHLYMANAPKREKDVRYEKPVDVKLADLKAQGKTEDAGWIEGYAAYFGNVDQQGDVIVKGAFAKTIAERVPAGKVKLMVKHLGSGGDTLDVAGTITEAKEDDKGLWIHSELSASEKAQAARGLVGEGHVSGMSIGYKILQSKPGTVGGEDVLFLTEIMLMEVTITPFPANESAQVTGAKEMQSGASESSDRARSEAESASLKAAEAARLIVRRKRLALMRLT